MATKSSYQTAQELNQRAAARTPGQKFRDMAAGGPISNPSGGAGRGWVNPARSDMNDAGSDTSYEQYQHEKSTGADVGSYSDWKKL